MSPLRALAAGLIGCALVACSGADAASENDAEIQAAGATSSKVGNIPLKEVSALGLRRTSHGNELLALGDRTRAIAIAKLPERGAPSDLEFETIDLEEALPSSLRAESDAQWEGIASDGKGRVFVLEENPGHVFVFDVDGNKPKLLHTIEIEPGDDRTNRDEWNADPNSRGEGLVLLANGHILLLKEKAPRRILELGPKGDEASGLRETGDLASSRAFPLKGERSKFVPLHVWELRDREQFPDLSELAVGPEGDVWVLSDEGAQIGRIDGTIDPLSRDDLNLRDKTALPRQIEKPEGLVVLPDGSFLVASDVPCEGARCTNLYWVSR